MNINGVLGYESQLLQRTKNIRAAAGFSLVELITVVVILGVITALALPKFANLGSAALERTMINMKAQVATQASLANKLAIIENLTPGTNKFLNISGFSVGMNHRYPNARGMQTLLGLNSSVWSTRSRNGSLYIWHNSIDGVAPRGHKCFVRYQLARGANSPAKVFIRLADCR